MPFKRDTVVALSIAGSLHIGIVAALTLSTPPEPPAMTLDHGFEMVELAPLKKLITPSIPFIKMAEAAQTHQPLAEPEAIAEVVPKPAVLLPEVAEIVTIPAPEIVSRKVQPETPPIITPPRKVLTAEQPKTLPLMLASIDDVYIPPVSHSRYLHNPKPRYPRAAKKRGMEGLVMVSVRVGRDGRPLEALIHTSSGYGVLDRAALKTVRSWRFEAARRGNTRVEGEVLVPINFELTEKG